MLAIAAFLVRGDVVPHLRTRLGDYLAEAEQAA